MKIFFSTLLIALLIGTTAEADVVWPALYTETKVSSLPIIALSLCVEWVAIRWLFQIDWKKAAKYTFAANLVSGLLGLLLRPLSGIVWELSLGQIVMWLFDWGTFNPVAWFFVPVIGGVVNAWIELLTIKFFWKEPFRKKSFWGMWLANWVTVGIATIWVVVYPPHL